MKKIIASAVGLALVGGVAVTTASAVESQFGGYWRTRMFAQSDFTGQDTASYNRTDNRTRLYYTAKFNDDFKFVNRFEFNSSWGDDNGGNIGSDGDTFRVKHSYADFTLGKVHTSIGQQGRVISRGFIFDDDFSGVVVTPTFGNFRIPVMYAMEFSDDVRNYQPTVRTTGAVDGAGDPILDGAGNPVLAETTAPALAGGDINFVAVSPSFQLDKFALTPNFAYLRATSDLDYEMAWLGLDVDATFDSFSAWGSFIYNTGDRLSSNASDDQTGYLVAGGGDVGIFHGQAFYASGQKNEREGKDSDAFVGAPGQSYYWSEIMGLGIFDNRASGGSPGAQITNIIAANLGVTLKPMDKLKLDFDVWWASLAEDNQNGDTDLGIEFDAKATYALMDDLNAEFVFAYLMADDATTVGDTKNDKDAIEGGVRLSLKF